MTLRVKPFFPIPTNYLKLFTGRKVASIVLLVLLYYLATTRQHLQMSNHEAVKVESDEWRWNYVNLLLFGITLVSEVAPSLVHR